MFLNTHESAKYFGTVEIQEVINVRVRFSSKVFTFPIFGTTETANLQEFLIVLSPCL